MLEAQEQGSALALASVGGDIAINYRSWPIEIAGQGSYGHLTPTSTTSLPVSATASVGMNLLNSRLALEALGAGSGVGH